VPKIAVQQVAPPGDPPTAVHRPTVAAVSPVAVPDAAGANTFFV